MSKEEHANRFLKEFFEDNYNRSVKMSKEEYANRFLKQSFEDNYDRSVKMSKEEYANGFLKEFFEYYYKRKQLLFDKLSEIYSLISYFAFDMEEVEEDFDLRQTSKISFIEATKLIDSFYKSINIDFKTDEIVNSGVFDIIRTNSIHDAYDYELASGNNDYIDGYNGIRHKAVNVYNNGLVTDTITWVHEISHYRNQPDIKRNDVNGMLTELLAFTEEFLYMDYLEKVGYQKEVEIFKLKEYQNFNNVIKVGYYIVRIYLLYFQLGEVSKENYKYLYKEDYSYEKALNIFTQEIKNNKNIIFIILWYSIAVISIYNYENYKEDKNYLNKIEELNTKMNQDITLEEALKIIDIELNQKSLEKILEKINKFKDSLLQEKTKTL